MQGNATRSVAPVCETEVIAHSAGHGTSMAFSKNVFVDSDTGTPSFTSASAALRFSGVIRLSVPSSSSFPQRPQFDNSVCQASNCASLTRGRDDDPWEAASPTSAAAMPREQTRIETVLENASALMMSPHRCLCGFFAVDHPLMDADSRLIQQHGSRTCACRAVIWTPSPAEA